MQYMDEVDFYLEDLKSKFDKINPKEYYLSYSNNIEYNIIYWFIKKYSKEIEIESEKKLKNYKDKKIIFSYRSKDIETCFDKNGNFYPIHDLPTKLRDEIIKKYEIHGQ